jgi:CrcB protein
MKRLLLVSLAGAFGTGARYLLGGLITTAVGPGFPWGTLTINATGSFLMAGVMYLGLDVGVLSHELRTVLAVGVLGGFTTYSSFNHETLALLQRGAWGHALGYASATLLGCLLAGALGLAFARGLAGPW